EGGRKIDESGNKNCNSTHSCAVIVRVVRAAQYPPQHRCSEHLEADDLLFSSRIDGAALCVTTQQILDCGQLLSDRQNDFISGPQSGKCQLYACSNHDTNERPPTQPK